MRYPYSVVLTTILLLTACNSSVNNNASPEESRLTQISLGSQVFQKNCQVCHGAAAAGMADDWRQPDANGNYPAPPLNGTAHTWHHSQEVLLRTVNNGGVPLGGTMPPFKNVLSEEEKLAVLAYIKSLWPKELYAAWQERFGDE